MRKHRGCGERGRRERSRRERRHCPGAGGLRGTSVGGTGLRRTSLRRTSLPGTICYDRQQRAAGRRALSFLKTGEECLQSSLLEARAGTQPMSKIRINELARELEVKPNVILDILPELGVADKKTHSSSLDDDVALAIRRRLVGGEEEPHAQEPRTSHEAGVGPRPPEHMASAPGPFHETVRASHEVAAPPPPAPDALVSQPRETLAQEDATPPQRVAPLRPPLATGSPLVPPLVSQTIARGATIPVKPAPPPPKPGQILSGPRQPLPSGLAPSGPAPSGLSGPAHPRPQMPPASEGRTAEAAPLHPGLATRPAPAPAGPGLASTIPSMPAPPRPAIRPGAPSPQTAGGTIGSGVGTGISSGGPLRPPAKPNLAGQPAARPVVPPRPDMLAKLSRPGAPMPGAPAPARPGFPTTGPPAPCRDGRFTPVRFAPDSR